MAARQEIFVPSANLLQLQESLDWNMAYLHQIRNICQGQATKEIEDEILASIISLKENLQTLLDQEFAQYLQSMDTDAIDTSTFDQMKLEFDYKIPERITTDCSICFEAVMGDSFYIPGCDHAYCLFCFASWIGAAVKSPTQKFPLLCAVDSCHTFVIPNAPMASILGAEVLSTFEERNLIGARLAMYCPNKQCSQLIRELDSVKCSNCDLDICFNCKSASHEPQTCTEFQKIPMRDREPEDIALYKCAEEKKWRQCPSCRIIVEKKDGCNFIRCACGIGFCYSCGVEYCQEQTADNPHGRAGCTCLLFDVPQDPNVPVVPIQEPPRNLNNFELYLRGREQDMERDVYGRRMPKYGSSSIVDRQRGTLPKWLREYYNNNRCNYC